MENAATSLPDQYFFWFRGSGQYGNGLNAIPASAIVVGLCFGMVQELPNMDLRTIAV
jgi:hypothetical protein